MICVRYKGAWFFTLDLSKFLYRVENIYLFIEATFLKTIQRIIRGTCLWEVAFLYVKFDSSELDVQFE